MRTLYLMARKLDSSPAGNRYMLAIGPNSDLGLSKTPISDHSYATIDELCEAIDECQAIPELDVAVLRVAVDGGEFYSAQITEEAALCMGFKV